MKILSKWKRLIFSQDWGEDTWSKESPLLNRDPFWNEGCRMVEQENSHVSPVMLDSPSSQYINMYIFESANFVTEQDSNIKQIKSNESSFNDQPLNNLFGEYYSNDFEGLQEDKDSTQEQIPFYSDLSFEDAPTSVWGNGQLDMDAIKIDEIFQVDKEDLVHTPTLAQLNAYDEPLFGSYDYLYPLNKSTSEYVLPEVNSEVQFNSTSNCLINFPSTSTAVKIEEPFSKSSSPLIDEGTSSKYNLKQHLTSDATHSVKKFQVKKRKPSISKIKKNVPHKYSNKNSKKVHVKEMPVLVDPEESDSETSSDSSDDKTESDKEGEKCNFLEKKNSRYFWQYNMQAKGPKGPKGVKIKFSEKLSDIPGVADPVFNSQFPTKGIKHSGKARKGDGNDLTPNPKKLYNIGKELEELSSVIDCLTPANELPASARSKSRKEKNKLASRACRLKKKAHHEANKLKLFGLQKEQTNLINCIADVKRVVGKKLERKFSRKKGTCIKSEKEMQKKPTSTVAAVKSIIKKRAVTKVAGCTPDFVNQILKNVASGDEKGGLDKI